MTTQLHITLCPSFPHFHQFVSDPRINGIRINSAMLNLEELEKELSLVDLKISKIPLYFDIKGRQLRIEEVVPNNNYLEIILNHPIKVETPTPVLFKAGCDWAVLKEVINERKLVFDGGPTYQVKAGESLHIRHPSLQVLGKQFTEFESQKIEKVLKAGFQHFYLSYVESQKDVDEFRELIGKNADLILKIENCRGIEFVKKYQQLPNTRLCAARGDLYVELEKPHHILAALKFIIGKDPQAVVGSRIFLSIAQPQGVWGILKRLPKLYINVSQVVELTNLQKLLEQSLTGTPECHDFTDIAWLRDLGYKTMLLCDEICLKEPLLEIAVSAFEAFRESPGELHDYYSQRSC